MVGASKILTVSYGTFSCTLEGFDDPFSTMRGIAEYFRDLAADDRYFGAEPPTPDAEMLHKIAQREVQRRVEAQVKDDGIVLRQLGNAPEAATPSAPAPATAPVEEDDDAALASADDAERNMFVDLEDVSDLDDEDADDNLAAEHIFDNGAPAAQGLHGPGSGHDSASVAAKLSRIRAVVSTGAAAPQENAFAGSIDTAFEDIDPTAEAEVHEPTITADDVDMEFGYVADAGDTETATSHVSSGPGADEIVEASEALYVTKDTEDATAPVQQQDEDTAETAELAEAASEAEDVTELEALDGVGDRDSSDETLWGDDDIVEDAPAEDADAPDISGAPEATAETPEPQATTEETADETIQDVTPEAMEVSQDAASEDVAETAETKTADAPAEGDRKLGLAARIVKLKRAALEMSSKPEGEDSPAAPPETEAAVHHVVEESAEDRPGDEVTAADDTEVSDEPSDIDDTSEDVPEETVATGSEDDQEDHVEALTEETGAEHADDSLETTAGTETQQPPASEQEESETETGAEAEREDDRSAMLAAIAQAARDAEERVVDEEPEPVKKKERAITRPVFEAEEGSGEAFKRILEQTNSQLDDSEGNRRRSAIAHLKAAVAATKADRLLKRRKPEDEQSAEEQSQYREDLAKVVRPQRPVTEPREPVEAPEMKGEDKPAPLMLVSELRVDDKDEAEGTQVRVRDTDTGTPDYDEEMEGASTSFAEFVEEMGATELPELLEAAAAYTAFVEGRKEFSRPQLMRRVANFEQEGFTREAGLRSFGQLLRQGKIQKLKRGQFTITDDSRFNPEARLAGE